MNGNRAIEYASPGLTEAVFCAALILLITNIIPFFLKHWFVEPTGNITIAPFFGFLFAVGLLFRQRWARHSAIFLFVFIAVANIVVLVSNPQKPGFWAVSLLSALLLWRLTFSEKLKQYTQ